VKDEYPMLISFSNIRDGSLVVWCTVFCRVYRLKAYCAMLIAHAQGQPVLYQVYVKDEYLMLIFFSKIREGSLVHQTTKEPSLILEKDINIGYNCIVLGFAILLC
jgi:hypothetical protein